MNKLYLWGSIITAAMLGATYYTLALNSKGNATGDIVNMLAIAGAVALVLITVWVVVKYVRQMQTDTATGELADETWDDIGEYKNPVPMGWAIMFLGTMVWGMWYFLVGYPVNAFSQIGQYNEEVAQQDAQFQKKYANIKGDTLVDMGESVYLVECVACHGLNADGNGEIDAANLNHRLSEKVVKYTIEHGSNYLKSAYPSGMPAGMAFGEDVDKLAKYVAGGLKGDAPAAWATCAGCHGQDGKGMTGVAPSIAKWNQEIIVDVLNNGKAGAIGKMPAMDRLNSKQKEAVAAYVMSLSKGE